MTTDLLSPGLPNQIADLYESHEIEWKTGWGDYKTHTCLHGALLRPCAEPGDETMWSILLSSRGLTIGWNDEQLSVDPIVSRLREQTDPDEAEMVAVFGSQWVAARTVCRQFAQASREQLGDARAAWAAWDAWAARDAWAAWAARAARVARDARAAWDAWAAWAAWDARAARAAWAAFYAVIGYDGIDEATSWNRGAFNLLVEPWQSVFGVIEFVAVSA